MRKTGNEDRVDKATCLGHLLLSVQVPDDTKLQKHGWIQQIMRLRQCYTMCYECRKRKATLSLSLWRLLAKYATRASETKLLTWWDQSKITLRYSMTTVLACNDLKLQKTVTISRTKDYPLFQVFSYIVWAYSPVYCSFNWFENASLVEILSVLNWGSGTRSRVLQS